MKVTLRTKGIKGNRKSLYLDFYPAITDSVTGKSTRRNFLGLYIIDKPKSPIEKQHNKETWILAETIAAKRQLEIQADDYGFLKKKAETSDLLAYFKDLAVAHKSRSQGDRNNWYSLYNYLHRFTNGKLTTNDISKDFCLRFKDYLQKSKTFRSTRQKLATNSAVGYFNTFKRIIKKAYSEGILSSDFTADIPNIKKIDTIREFLTLDEVRLLAKTPCDIDVLKRAALFSALTGLRYCDIAKLTWQEVHCNDKKEYSIHFIQKKTKGSQILPIAHDAYLQLGDRKEATQKVFLGLMYSGWQNQKIQDWVNRAGISRKITFHCFRHTFATIQLSLGTNITTIQNMLGHRSIQTTLMYAKVIDSVKREAANKMLLDE